MARSNHPWPPEVSPEVFDAWLWAWAIIPAVDKHERDMLRRHHAAHEHIRRRRQHGYQTPEIDT